VSRASSSRASSSADPPAPPAPPEAACAAPSAASDEEQPKAQKTRAAQEKIRPTDREWLGEVRSMGARVENRFLGGGCAHRPRSQNGDDARDRPRFRFDVRRPRTLAIPHHATRRWLCVCAIAASNLGASFLQRRSSRCGQWHRLIFMIENQSVTAQPRSPNRMP
jgi:hypothetical protein